MSYSRNALLALGAFIVAMYTWVLLPYSSLPDSVFHLLVREDGLIESMGALWLLAAGGLFFICFLRARRRGSARIMWLFLLGMAVALFIGAGEEVSWGQRFFGIDVPAPLKEDNYQQELNLHNQSAFDWWGVWQVFEIFTLLFAVALPLAAWRSPRVLGFASRYVPIVPLRLSALFLLAELMAALSALAYPGSWKSPAGTPTNDVMDPGGLGHGAGITEMCFSLVYAAVAFNLLRTQQSSRAVTLPRSSSSLPTASAP